MVTLKRSLCIVAGLLLTVFLVACGGVSNHSANSASSSAAAQQASMQASARNDAPLNDHKNSQKNSQKAAQTTGQYTGQVTSQNASNGQMGSQSNGQANNQNNNPMPATNANILIRTAQVNVNGTMETILTTADGMTLYYRTSDPAPASTCIGACAKTWIPLVTNGMVISAMPLTGNLTLHRTANGNQVEYNNHPLYTYVGDHASGQINGQGQGNVWYIINVMLQKQHW